MTRLRGVLTLALGLSLLPSCASTDPGESNAPGAETTDTPNGASTAPDGPSSAAGSGTSASAPHAESSSATSPAVPVTSNAPTEPSSNAPTEPSSNAPREPSGSDPATTEPPADPTSTPAPADSTETSDGSADISPTSDATGTNSSISCTGITPQRTELALDEVRTLLEAKDFQFINVHTPYAGEIPGTDAHIAYTDVDAIEAQLGNDKGAKVLVYCRTGPMSKSAGDELVKRGYCNVFDMPEGFQTWSNMGYPFTAP